MSLDAPEGVGQIHREEEQDDPNHEPEDDQIEAPEHTVEPPPVTPDIKPPPIPRLPPEVEQQQVAELMKLIKAAQEKKLPNAEPAQAQPVEPVVRQPAVQPQKPLNYFDYVVREIAENGGNLEDILNKKPTTNKEEANILKRLAENVLGLITLGWYWRRKKNK